MNITDANGKNICILGYGREGQAMVAALHSYAPDAIVTIRDKKDGAGYTDNLEQFDTIIASPGIPPSEIPHGVTPTNSTQIFLDSIDQNATVIGVTGSKGKSTTASLIHAILRQAGKKSILVGNIGEPSIGHIQEVTADTTIVMEMSSYQLLRITRSPHIAVITSFFPEHLDYHGSLDAYKDAKSHITRFQNEDDTVFYYAHSDGAKDIALQSKGTHFPYSEDDSPISVIDTKLVGTHNLCNIAGAAAVARHFGIDDATIIEAARTFDGLPHRLKNLGEHDGIIWVDDAISTTPQSTIAALHALTPDVKTIILGGQDRGNDFTELGKVIASLGIEQVILMGESGPRIGEAITSPDIIVHKADSMDEATGIAKKHKPKTGHGKPICLLSPASPSYGMFKNFEEKGDMFRKSIFT